MPKSPVGKFIDQRMEELGIPSVKQLAKMTGLSFSGLSKIRNTEMAMKSKTVEALAKALKCDYWEIKDLTPDEAPPPRQRKGVPTQFHKRQTICWDCKNAVPEGKRGCSWSRKLEPVEGWKAIETEVTRIDGGMERQIKSALVIECPLFRPDADLEEPKNEPQTDQPPKWDGEIYFEDELDALGFARARWGI